MSRVTDATRAGASALLRSSPIDPAIVRRAAEWMARLWSESATDADHQACEQWRAAHPDHECAWRRLQGMQDKLDSVPRAVARHTLLEPALARPSRRRSMQLLGLGVLGLGVVAVVRETDSWQAIRADYHTRTGEIREIALPDGTRVVLDTASALDVRFTDGERLITLLSGAILVTTAHEAGGRRPFRVRSEQGEIEALGTRFSVRQADGISRVEVFEGAVALTPSGVGHAAVRVEAGQGAAFTNTRVEQGGEAREEAAAWAEGRLVAENMELAAFLAELGRYRSGLLRADPAIGGLRVTGVFSLRDTDRALQSLSAGLPVEVVYRTRYWVTVRAR